MYQSRAGCGQGEIHLLRLEKKQEGLAVAKYWLESVIGKETIFMSRELGVLKQYRREVAPFLTLPLFMRSLNTGYEVAMSWCNLSTKAFKWSLGVGLLPVHYFLTDDLLLFGGKIKQVISIVNNILGLDNENKNKRVLVDNINRYLIR